MLPNYYKPYFVPKKKLIRIGPNTDGGYVIHKDSLKYTKKIVTLGLSDDWEFEKHFLKLNKKVKVDAYDHTVNFPFWFKRFVKDFIHFFLLKKIKIKKILDIFKYISYCIFFSGKNNHYKIKVGNSNEEINLKKILKNKKVHDYSILLKIDIEGDEYKIIDQINKFSNIINTIIIEFHNTNKSINKKKIKKFLLHSKVFKLVHIHANNYSFDKKNFPNCFEFTIVNKKKIKTGIKKTNLQYPLKGIDYPNYKRGNDIKLNFNE